MTSLLVGRLCRTILKQTSGRTNYFATSKLSSESLLRCGISTSASKSKREIKVIEPVESEESSLVKTDRHGKLAELNDPFDLKIVARGGDGSKDNPDLIPSMFNRRIVGHICEEDQSHITWFYLYKGEPQKCQCGHWFKLVPVDPL